MALQWVDMALEARLACHDPALAFRQLKEWLSKEIYGKETARKTATQTRRLWLAREDAFRRALEERLRQQSLASGTPPSAPGVFAAIKDFLILQNVEFCYT